MKGIVAAILALLILGASNRPKSKAHDHTIYVLRGSPDKLSEFHQKIGKNWKGGKLLDKADGGTAVRYWAFSDRTAPQAREFIFGTLQFGLQLEMAAYDERRYFPTERLELDSIALKCGLAVDPFFITPQHELQLMPEPKESFRSVACALGELKASKALRELPTGFVGHEAPREKRH